MNSAIVLQTGLVLRASPDSNSPTWSQRVTIIISDHFVVAKPKHLKITSG